MDSYLNKIEDLSNGIGDLLEFNSQLIDALNTSTEGIAILDADGNYIWLNKAHEKMFGYEHKELIGQSWTVLYNEEDLDYFAENVFPVIARDGKWKGKATAIQKDKTTKVEEMLFLTALENGGLICTCIDITE